MGDAVSQVAGFEVTGQHHGIAVTPRFAEIGLHVERGFNGDGPDPYLFYLRRESGTRKSKVITLAGPVRGGGGTSPHEPP